MPHDSEQHAQHDPLIVVSLAAGELTGTDRDLAAALIATCADSASLHDDLLAIARATAALPPATRPRDFQLSPDQAARLRPAGWRRFVAAFASPQLAMTRQLGIGLTTLGLAGLLVSVLPTVQLGMGGSAAAPAGAPAAAPAGSQQFLSAAESSNGNDAQAAPSAAAAPAATGLRSVGNDAPSPSPDLVFGTASSPARTYASGGAGVEGNHQAQAPEVAPTAAPGVQRDAVNQPEYEGDGASLVLIASLILLAAGIALLLTRRIARGLTRN
jgi:hypothetical protein